MVEEKESEFQSPDQKIEGGNFESDQEEPTSGALKSSQIHYPERQGVTSNQRFSYSRERNLTSSSPRKMEEINEKPQTTIEETQYKLAIFASLIIVLVLALNLLGLYKI